MLEDEIRKARVKYAKQKRNAKVRGIDWRLTFPEWLEWWGEDYFRRGIGRDRLQMQRFHDKGPYALGNIRKGYPSDNSKTAGNCRRNAHADVLRRVREDVLDNAEVCASKDWRAFSDDEWEILRATGRQASEVVY